MARKKKRKPVKSKVTPSAISIRSGDCGVCTVLFDASVQETIIALPFDPIHVGRCGMPIDFLNKLRRLAGRGKWMAIESAPEIIDSDGVPGLDIVFRRKSRSKGLPIVKPPKDGFWYDPVAQYLDLPTGKLCVVFDPEFFKKGYEPDSPAYEISSQDDEDLHNKEYSYASSYIINCKPGFYHATAFTSFNDWHYPDEESRPELAVYLTPVEKPKSFKMSDAVLPVYPEGQDHETLKRATLGLKPRKPLKPSLNGKDTYVADVARSIGRDMMELPAKFKKKLGVEPGVMVTLEVDGKILDGIVTESSTPHPSVWELIEKEKRTSRNFATFQLLDNMLAIEILKVARKDGFDLPEGISSTGKLKVVREKGGEVKKIPTKQTAVESANTIPLPKKRGKPGKHVKALIPEIEKCFSWNQACFIEKGRKSFAAIVSFSAPIEGTNIHGTPYRMGAKLEAVLTTLRKDGSLLNEEHKTFRGWPNGIDRAFEWVSKQTQGGVLWTKRFELNRNFWDKKKLKNHKEAEALAIAAWHEVFGIDEE